jgi:hypothetical protein
MTAAPELEWRAPPRAGPLVAQSGVLTFSAPQTVGTIAVPFGLPGLKHETGLGVPVVRPASVDDAELPAASVERTWKR